MAVAQTGAAAEAAVSLFLDPALLCPSINKWLEEAREKEEPCCRRFKGFIKNKIYRKVTF